MADLAAAVLNVLDPAGRDFSPMKSNAEGALRWLAPAAALGVTAALAWLGCRGIPRTGFDQHYYLECVKSFRIHLPTSFGSGWPYGYPVLGSVVSRTGLSAYHSLLVVTACGLFAVYWLLWPILSRALGGPRAFAALCCLAATAILHIEFSGVRSEIAFSAFFLAAVRALAGWPDSRSVALAVFAAVISFSLRYAGAITLVILACWLVCRWGAFRSTRGRLGALVAVLSAFAVCALLLLWNRMASGHFAGVERGFGHGFDDLALNICDFGWGVVTALTTIGVRKPFLAYGALYWLVGWSVFLGLLGFASWRWLRPSSCWSRPLALGLIAYGAGMVALRCYDGFDHLYSARFFLPALPLFFALICETASAWPRTGMIAIVAAFAVPGIAICSRGISPALAPNFSEGVAAIGQRLRPDDEVGVNLPGFYLSAWFDCPVGEVDSPSAPDVFQRYRFVVLVAKAQDRSASRYVWSTDIQELLRRIERGGYSEMGRWPGYVVLERDAEVR